MSDPSATEIKKINFSIKPSILPPPHPLFPSLLFRATHHTHPHIHSSKLRKTFFVSLSEVINTKLLRPPNSSVVFSIHRTQTPSPERLGLSCFFIFGYGLSSETSYVL